MKTDGYYTDEVVSDQDARARLIAFWLGTLLPAWDHGKCIEDLNKEKVGIETLSNPFMYILVDDNSPELCRLVNDS